MMISPSVRIALTYLLLAALWIFFSDNLQQLFTAPYFVERLESLRHWIFIFATTAVLFLLLHRENAAARRATGSLRESEKNFRILTETIAAAIFLHRGGRLCFVNPKAIAYSGYTREELLAMDLWQLVSSEYRDAIRERCLARLEPDVGAICYELRLITKQGEERWLEVTADSIEFEGARVGLASAYDITERKRAEQKINILNTELEQRVIERTAELEAANVQLRTSQASIRELNMELQQRAQKLQALVDSQK